MRISLRTGVQAITLFVLLVFLNAYISLFHDQNRQTSKRNSGTESESQLGHQLLLHPRDDPPGLKVDKHQNEDISILQDNLNTRSSQNDIHSHLKTVKTQEINVTRKSIIIKNSVVLTVREKLKNAKTAASEKLKAAKTIASDNGNSNAPFDTEIDYGVDTSESRPTELSDIFISVKTSKKFHNDRLGLLLDTWALLARDETYFFTDGDDPELQKRTRGHVINTNCSSLHSRVALCCKMSVEYDYYIASNKRWFCHVDDDTYINIPELARLLRKYNHTEDWYLGKPSLTHPLEMTDPEHPSQKVAFWFATGGAGICISRSLALKMMPYTAGGRFKSVCAKIRLPDDCTIGYIIYANLRKELTVVPQFHSHLEGLWLLKPDKLDQQITVSHNWSSVERLKNIVHVNGFSEQDDPTRFRSIHCHLFPYLKGCPLASSS